MPSYGVVIDNEFKIEVFERKLLGFKIYPTSMKEMFLVLLNKGFQQILMRGDVNENCS